MFFSSPLEHDKHDMDYGYGGSAGMLDGYKMGMGHGMSHGWGYGMDKGGYETDFGIIAEVTVQAGLNTFQIQGLGAFTDINQLAGRGVLVS